MNERQKNLKEKFRHWTTFDYTDFVSKAIIQSYGPFGHRIFDDEIDHIVQGLESLVDTLTGEKPGGSFIQALARKDIYEAALRADTINIKALPIYLSFMYNELPADFQNISE